MTTAQVHGPLNISSLGQSEKNTQYRYRGKNYKESWNFATVKTGDILGKVSKIWRLVFGHVISIPKLCNGCKITEGRFAFTPLWEAIAKQGTIG